jgi:hypothetical protein
MGIAGKLRRIQAWTFEPGATPLSGFVWTYHDNELTMEDINYSVIEFIREIA